MEAGEGEAPSLVEPALELLMPQHDDLSRSLLTLDQASTLIAVIEMSQLDRLISMTAIKQGCAACPTDAARLTPATQRSARHTIRGSASGNLLRAASWPWGETRHG